MNHRRKRIITEIARKSGFMDRERLHTMSTPDLEKYLKKLEAGKDKTLASIKKKHRQKKEK